LHLEELSCAARRHPGNVEVKYARVWVLLLASSLENVP
jgi:hypothetical protein